MKKNLYKSKLVFFLAFLDIKAMGVTKSSIRQVRLNSVLKE